MTETEIFISECQSTAERGISRLEAEMLSSFSVLYNNPTLAYSNDFKLPSRTLPSIPEFNPTTKYETISGSAHTGHVWSTNEMDYLWSKIRSAFESGGIGLTSELQSAIFQSDRERKLLALNDSLQAINAGFGAKGFTVPSNILTGPRNEVILKYQFDMENQSREIAKTMDEHARLNWQFCVDKGIDAEKFHADFTSRYDQLYLELIKSSMDKYRESIDIEMLKFKGKLDTIDTNFQAYKLESDVGLAALNSEIEKKKLEIQAAAYDADTAIRSHSSEVSRLNQSYSAYADLVKSFAQTATGGLIRFIKQ